MYEGTRNILGLMSGTSLDAMDAALVRFSHLSGKGWEVLETYTFTYPEALKNLVKACFADAALMERTDDAFADWTIECIKAIQKQSAYQIDGVGNHGQTIFHEPHRKFTFQAGCLPRIATETGLPLVTDFRKQDVLLGGQGAPLVPMGDHHLFGTFEAALNLGGFANATIGTGTLAEGVKEAFDICPVNYVLNSFALELGLPYDDKGHIASKGNINNWVLEELNSLYYYSLGAPKSLGGEWVEEHVLPKIDYLSPSDALATFCEHIAVQIGTVLQGKRVLVTGGGAWNDYLIGRVRSYGVKLILPDKQTVNFKEAVVFAYLAFLRFKGECNVLGTTTGSGKNHSSGKVFYP